MWAGQSPCCVKASPPCYTSSLSWFTHCSETDKNNPVPFNSNLLGSILSCTSKFNHNISFLNKASFLSDILNLVSSRNKYIYKCILYYAKTGYFKLNNYICHFFRISLEWSLSQQASSMLHIRKTRPHSDCWPCVCWHDRETGRTKPLGLTLWHESSQVNWAAHSHCPTGTQYECCGQITIGKKSFNLSCSLETLTDTVIHGQGQFWFFNSQFPFKINSHSLLINLQLAVFC